MKKSSAFTTLALVVSIAILSQGCNRHSAEGLQAKPYPMMTIEKGSMTDEVAYELSKLDELYVNPARLTENQKQILQNLK